MKPTSKTQTIWGGIFSVSLLGMSSLALGAEDPRVLAGKELRNAVSGKTVYLMTPIGAEIPIRYRPNGTIHSTISASLAALGGERVKSDTGRWWVVREQLCQRWNNWADKRSHCYKFRMAGSSVEWQRNDGQTGTARMSAQ